MSQNITNTSKKSPPRYGTVRTVTELGALARLERKRQRLTLHDVYDASGLTTRFLSEFERGKPNVSLNLVMRALQALGLELIILPRGEAERLLAARAREARQRDGSEEDADGST